MSLDELLLILHLLAGAAWIGAALALQVIAAGMRTSSPEEVVDHFALDAESVGKSVFAPAIVLLLTGIALVARSDLAWTEPWILVGFAAFVVALSIGGAFLIPEGRRIAELAREPNHDPTEVLKRTRRRFLVARVDLLVLTLAVVDMVVRPGG